MFVAAAGLAMTLGACGPGQRAAVTPAPPPPGGLIISPQNDGFSAGRNRLSVVIQDAGQRPVLGATATVEVRSDPGVSTAARPLGHVGPDYPGLPIYTGVIDLPHPGSWLLVVRVQAVDGTRDAGQAMISAEPGTDQLAVGDAMPPLAQPVAGPGVSVASLDSGVPPDPWHTTTVATGLSLHRPMLIYVGEPGRCLTRICGDTVAVLTRACAALCGPFLFEHIEVHNPADSPAFNPAWIPFHLRQEQPWVYLVNDHGVIADRFEGPAPPDQLLEAARGTLAGRVPAT
jgi:hypothetical protein